MEKELQKHINLEFKTTILFITKHGNISDCVHPPVCKSPTNSLCLCFCCCYQTSKTNIWSIVDRIDIHIEVPSVDYEKLSGDRLGETSETIRARVQAARDIQNKRFAEGEASDIVCNADMRVREIRQFCRLQDEGQSLMRAATSCCA